MDQEIINLYDEYTHRPLSREVFVKRLVKITGSMAAALLLLPQLEGNYAMAQTNAWEEDLFIDRISYPSAAGTMKGYLARPKKEGKYPTVVIIHENRGLNPHIEDVTRRAAKAGFLALAPDALSILGGTPSNEDEARALFQKLDSAQNTANFAAAFTYLAGRSDSNGKMGCVGFCWGGAMSNQLAVNVPDLKAAVAFYGRQPEAADVPKINASLQLHYASLDERVNAGISAFETALKSNNKAFELYMYDGVNHAFHNDTSAARYNEAAAKLAWQRSMDFLHKHCG